MKNDLPLVSICIPTYNGGKYIEEALNSAINQTYNNLEIIISDDASVDRTIEIIDKYKNLTLIPFYIYNHLPNGIGGNWNNCVRNANGDYIKFLFQDDTLESTCIEKMISIALKDREIGLVYCSRKFIFDTSNIKDIEWVTNYGKLHQSWYNLTIKDKVVFKGSELLKNRNLLKFPGNKIGEPTAVLLKKECFNTIGYFSNQLKQTLDMEYWYRVMKYYKVVFLEETLVSFRLHEEQATVVNINNFLYEGTDYRKSIYLNLFWKLNINNQKTFFIEFNLRRFFSRFKSLKNKIFK